jgi:glycosyltransferase involved in cell wall biosynthesis
VPVEAMLLGTPVVYTSSTFGPEAVEDGVTGLLANPNDPDDIAEKTLTVLRDPAAAAARAANALTVARTRFSVEECVNRSVAFYARVLAQHSRREG